MLGPGDGYASGYGAVLGGGVVTRSANDALAATFQVRNPRDALWENLVLVVF